MELPSRPKNDRYTRPGQYAELERRLRANPANANIPILVVLCLRLPHASRALSFCRHATAHRRTTRHRGRTTQRRLYAHPDRAAAMEPQLPRPAKPGWTAKCRRCFLFRSMQIHSASAYELIADAYRLGDDRPLILAGGAKAIYEPWDFFGFGPGGAATTPTSS